VKIASSYIRKSFKKIAYFQEGNPQVGNINDIVRCFKSGDLIIVNDSATAPMSLEARDRFNNSLELRLLRTNELSNSFLAVAFVGGSWKVPTENRKIIDPMHLGERLHIGEQVFSVRKFGPTTFKLCAVDGPEFMSTEIYRAGRMIQYSYMDDEVPLWASQSIFASRPWSSEAPSAAFAFSWNLIFQLIANGVNFASITHGAGLSSIGHVEIDEILPLTEVSMVTSETLSLIEQTRMSGGRVIGIGTSVVRAVEAAKQLNIKGMLTNQPFENSLRISSKHRIDQFDGILTGLHQEGESHFELLNAFASSHKIEALLAEASLSGCLTHEFGDFMLLLKD